MNLIIGLFLLGATQTSRSINLYGNSTIGYYYMKAMVGTPP